MPAKKPSTKRKTQAPRRRTTATKQKTATRKRTGTKQKSATKKTPAYAVRNSPIHGRGVFATRTIRKGAEILEYRGQRTTWEIGSERQGQNPDEPFHTFLFELEDGRVIDATVRGNAARWINHSCDPNCEAF